MYLKIRLEKVVGYDPEDVEGKFACKISFDELPWEIKLVGSFRVAKKKSVGEVDGQLPVSIKIKNTTLSSND